MYTWVTNYTSHEWYVLSLFESRTILVTKHFGEFGGDVMLHMSHVHMSHEWYVLYLYETRTIWVTNHIREYGGVMLHMKHELYESRTICAISIWVKNYTSHESHERVWWRLGHVANESRTIWVTGDLRSALSHELYETRAVWESMVEMGSCYLLAMDESCRTLEYVTSLKGMCRVLCVGAQPWWYTAHVTGDGDRNTIFVGDKDPSKSRRSHGYVYEWHDSFPCATWLIPTCTHDLFHEWIEPYFPHTIPCEEYKRGLFTLEEYERALFSAQLTHSHEWNEGFIVLQRLDGLMDRYMSDLT